MPTCFGKNIQDQTPNLIRELLPLRLYRIPSVDDREISTLAKVLRSNIDLDAVLPDQLWRTTAWDAK